MRRFVFTGALGFADAVFGFAGFVFVKAGLILFFPAVVGAIVVCVVVNTAWRLATAIFFLEQNLLLAIYALAS